MSKVRLIGKNISFLAINRLVVAGVNFILFPFIIQHVGKEIYGVYLIVLSFTGYLALMDLGIMSALTKYVSEYRGNGDDKGVRSVVSASFSFYILVGALIGAALLLISFSFKHFFHVNSSDMAVAQELFWVAAATSILVWPLSTFRGVIQGLNLWSMDASVNIVSQIFNGVITFLLLSKGYGIVQVFLVNQLFIIVGSGFIYLYIKHKYQIVPVFPFLDMKVYKFIFNFSFFVFLGNLMSVFIFQIHNIIIGCFLSLSAISVYAVAFNIQNYLRSINSILGAPPWTVASEMQGRGDIDGQRKLMFKGTKYVTAVFVPVMIIIFVFAGPFITYWMGPGFKESILPARILIVFWFFNGTMELATGMLSARGIVRRPFLIQMGVALVNVVVILLFIKKLGIVAAALGLTTGMILVAFPLNLRLSLKMLGVSVYDFFDRSVKPNVIYYCFVALLSWAILRWFYPSGMAVTFMDMALIYGISLIFYYIFILQPSEKTDIRKLIGAAPLNKSTNQEVIHEY